LTEKLEQFSNDFWAQGDEYMLSEHGISGGHNAYQAMKVITRGMVGDRIVLRYDKEGKLIIDLKPLDMRWVPFELNEWYCLRTWRTAEQIRREYGDDIEVSGNENEVRSFYDDKEETVYIGGVTGIDLAFSGREIKKKPYAFGSPPVVVAMAATGFQFGDKGYLKHIAESFDWLNRNLYEEQNRSASIAQTLGMYAYLSAWVQQKTDGRKVADEGPKPNSITAYNKDEVPVRVELGELSDGFINAFQQISHGIDRGSSNDTEAGVAPGDDSAIKITTLNGLSEGRQKSFKDTVADLQKMVFRKAIDQLIKLGTDKGDTEVGGVGMSHRYSVSQLGDPSTYRITYVPKRTSKELNIANTVVAAGQRGMLPDRYILENTLEAENPDGIIRDMAIQQSKAMHPEESEIDLAIYFIELADELEGADKDIAISKSMMHYDNAIVILKQRDMAMMAPQVQPGQPNQPAKEEVKPNMQGFPALTGPGGGRPTARMEAS